MSGSIRRLCISGQSSKDSKVFLQVQEVSIRPGVCGNGVLPRVWRRGEDQMIGDNSYSSLRHYVKIPKGFDWCMGGSCDKVFCRGSTFEGH